MSYYKIGKRFLRTVTVTAFTPIAYTIVNNVDMMSWFPKMVIIRKELIKNCFNSNIEIPKTGLKYVEHPVLEQDIHNCINNEQGGVKIVWAPPGTGKTTSVRHVISEELKLGNISGVLMVTPPRMSVEPDEWFRHQFKFFGIETLTQNEQLSTLIDNDFKKPFVIVIDQCDNFDFDDKLRRFIKVLAEDSNVTKKYVVLAICTDASKAATMREWNGGVKIKLVNNKYNSYKWSLPQIEKWVEHHIKNHDMINRENNVSHYNKFIKAATVAGTADFLITNSYPIEHKNIHQIEDSWVATSKYLGQIWESGQLLSSKKKCWYWPWS